MMPDPMVRNENSPQSSQPPPTQHKAITIDVPDENPQPAAPAAEADPPENSQVPPPDPTASPETATPAESTITSEHPESVKVTEAGPVAEQAAQATPPGDLHLIPVSDLIGHNHHGNPHHSGHEPVEPTAAATIPSPGHKGPKTILWILLVFIALLIAGYLAIDSRLIKTSINLPFHIFKQPSSTSAGVSQALISPVNATNIFDKTLDKALSTSSVTQTTTIKGQASTAAAGASENSVIHFDVSDLSKPHLDMNLGDEFPTELSINAKYVLSSGDGYANMTNLSGAKAASLNKLTPPFSSYLNKWFPLSQNGQSINDVPSNAIADLDTLNSLEWGNFIFGNLNQSQRQLAEEFAIPHKVYDYNSALVHRQTMDGKQYFVYDITINDQALLQLNQMIMSDFNVTMTNAVEQSISSFKASSDEFWVDPTNYELVKVVAHIIGDSPGYSTAIYSNYNDTNVAAVPQLQLTASDASSIFVGFYSVGL
jgi:hypothetical protein